MFGIMIDLLGTVALIVLVASIICTITPTPQDTRSRTTGKLGAESLWAKFYKIIEICALNIGKAKD